MKNNKSNIDDDGNEIKPAPRKRGRKKRVSAKIKKMALRYEAAWKKLYGESGWRQVFIDEGHERMCGELAREARILAESENFEPVKAIYAGSEKDPEAELKPDMLTGKYFEDDDLKF